jgi:pilus assembly protein CpaC
MHPKFKARVWSMAGLLALGLATMSSVPVWAQETSKDKAAPAVTAPMATFDKSGAVVVPVGGQSRFQMKSKKRIREAFNENDRVVQVSPDPEDPSKLILLGRTAGSSKLEVTDVDGNKENYLLVVQRDMELLKSLIRKTVPTASIEVTPIGDTGTNIILSGYATREDDRETARQLAEAVGLRVVVNNISIGGGGNVPHVQLDLTLAKVDRSKARSRGANFIVNGSTVSGGSILGGLLGLQGAGGGAGAGGGLGGASVGILPTAAQTVTGSGANLILGVIPSNLQIALSALRTEGLAKLISAPTVVARSGEQAELLVGGQVPVISAAAGINGPGVTYRPVGTELTFLPVVYGNGKIHLTVSPRVTSVVQGQALATSFGTSPAFEEQRLTTSIIVEPGQTVAIGGLIQTSVQGTVAKIPCLGDLPFVGMFFSYATQTEQEIELVILVTPRLIDPADCGQMPKPLPGSETRKPDDFEFFLETMLEAPRGQRNVFEGLQYKPAWMSSPSASVYPCAGGNCGAGLGGLHGGCATGNCAPGTCPTGNCGTAHPTATPAVTPPAALPSTTGAVSSAATEDVPIVIRPTGMKSDR